MVVEITETKTYLEISGGAGTQIEPLEIKHIVAPESETVVTVEVQEQTGNVVQITENPVTVEVIRETISVIDINTGPKGDKGDQGEPGTGLEDGEIHLTPKAASTGPRGTVFFNSADDHVYAGTN